MSNWIVSIRFKGVELESSFIVDGYSNSGGVLQLYTYSGQPGQQTKIQVFPLPDIEEVNINGVSI